MIQPKDPEELRLLEEEPGLQPKVEQPQAPPPTPSFLQLPKELLSGVSHSALLKVGACVLLCLQNSSYTLARRSASPQPSAMSLYNPRPVRLTRPSSTLALAGLDTACCARRPLRSRSWRWAS